MSFTKWAVLIVCAGTTISNVRAERITGLTTDNRLIAFDSANPSVGSVSVSVTGLAAGQNLVGIDLRPVDRALVGLGYDTGTGQGQVYSLDRTTGAATAISPLVSLTGTGFGFDFNPVPNALRIVTNGSGAGVNNNFRITMGGTGMFNIDTAVNIGGFPDPVLGITGAAYANNVPGGIAGQTTLYVIDAPTGQLYTQGSVNFPPGVSPNTGQLFLAGSLGVGSGLGINTGFDISGATGTAYVSLLSSGLFYTVDLTTGSATSVGGLAGNIADITVDPVPEPATVGLLGGGLAAILLRARRRRGARGSDCKRPWSR